MPNPLLDIALAIRSLARTPAMTSVALLSLALGIGANTAIFSLLNAVLLRRLPIPHPEDLVALNTTISDNVNNDENFTWPMFEQLAQQQNVFSSIFCWNGGSVDNFEVEGAHYAASLAQVTGSYYPAMQVQPLLGRFIGPHDFAPSSGQSSAVAVLSYRVWRNWFHGENNVVGQTIRIDAQPFTVIGVAPEGFSGLIIDGSADVTIPRFAAEATDERSPYVLRFDIFGRLKPGLSLAQARAAIQTLWPHVLDASMPPDYAGERKTRFFARRIKLESASTGLSFLRKRFSYALTILMAIVGAVLFIACLNIANLSLAKQAAQRQQSALRAALGASLWDLLRFPLIESLLLSFGGAIIGLAMAYWVSPLILRTAYSGYFPSAINAAPDLQVLSFTVAVALATALLFGIFPAWYAARSNPIDALKSQSRSVSSGANLFGKTLLVLQIALSLVLTLGAVLFSRTLSALHTTDVGYERDHLLTLQLFPQAGSGTPRNAAAYFQELLETVRRLPAVENASYSSDGPANEFEYLDPVFGSLAQASVGAVRETVAPGFFATARMHLLAGRDMQWSDAGHHVGVISQSLAKRLFGQDNPVGRTIYYGPHSHALPLTIVGVVNSASLWKVESKQPLAFYLLFEPGGHSWADEPLLDVRTSVDPGTMKSAIERQIRSRGYHYSLRTLTVSERLDSYLTVQRLTAMLSQFFAFAALLIACVGLYGLMSFHVTRRTTELGIRAALGAARSQLLASVLNEALSLAALGCALGLIASFALGRLIRSALFGVTPADPWFMLMTMLIILAVSTLAAFLPARRAAAVDPIIALRAE